MKSLRKDLRAWVGGFTFFVRVGLGCMFLASALLKIRQPYDFLSTVYSYELVGPKLGTVVAMVMPWLEMLVGICLLGGVFVSGALLTCAGMGAMFTFVLASALYRGLDISCGCFTSSVGGRISYITLIRAIVILVVSGAAYLGVVFLPSRPQEPAKRGISEDTVPVVS